MIEQERSRYQADLESKARIIEILGKENEENRKRLDGSTSQKEDFEQKLKILNQKFKSLESELAYKESKIIELKGFHDKSRQHNENLDKIL